jgi:hypothetical protein
VHVCESRAQPHEPEDSFQHLVGISSVCYLQEAGHYYHSTKHGLVSVWLALLVSGCCVYCMCSSVKCKQACSAATCKHCLHRSCVGLCVGFFWVCLPFTVRQQHVCTDGMCMISFQRYYYSIRKACCGFV